MRSAKQSIGIMMSPKADEINKLFDLSLGKYELAFIYLGYSGVIVRTSNEALVIDPADLLKDEEIKALKDVDLILFTHSHGDHYNSRATLELFEATDSPLLAEPLVVEDLKMKIPRNKIVGAKPRSTHVFGEIKVSTVQGIHRGPINLYHIKLGDVKTFHGGDSGYVSVENYPSDLAFLPTGTPSPTASPEHAFKMASELKPSVIVAIHGSASQSEELRRKVKGTMPETKVIISEPWKLRVLTLRGEEINP